MRLSGYNASLFDGGQYPSWLHVMNHHALPGVERKYNSFDIRQNGQYYKNYDCNMMTDVAIDLAFDYSNVRAMQCIKVFTSAKQSGSSDYLYLTDKGKTIGYRVDKIVMSEIDRTENPRLVKFTITVTFSEVV